MKRFIIILFLTITYLNSTHVLAQRQSDIHKFHISGKSTENEHIFLTFNPKPLYTSEKLISRISGGINLSPEKYTSDKEGSFILDKKLDLPVMSTLHFFDKKHSFQAGPVFDFIIEPGDSVYFKFVDGNLKFYGRNSAKYNCEYLIDKNMRDSLILVKGHQRQKDVKEWLGQCDSLTLESFKILNSYQTKISKKDYWTLNAIIVFYFQRFIKSDNLQFYGGTYRDGTYNEKYWDKLKDYKNKVWNEPVKKKFESNYWFKNTLLYVGSTPIQYMLDSCYLVHKAFNLNKFYQYFTNRFKGANRELLIYDLATNNGHTLVGEMISCLNNAINSKFIINKDLLAYLASAGITGSNNNAYDFSLPDTSGNLVHRTDLKGKVILIDTWFFGCGNCLKVHPLLDSIRDVIGTNDFQIVSVCLQNKSQDEKAQWLYEIKRTRQYTSPNNLNLFVSDGMKSSFVKNYLIVGSPTLILINKDGNIVSEPTDPRGDHGQALVKTIKENL